MEDTVGSELISRVDVQADSLGLLASSDVDAPEQLELPAPPKAPKKLTAAELGLLQTKVSHKEVTRKQKRAKKVLVHKKQEPDQEDEEKASLTKAMDKSSKQQAKSADEDVEQLGGQLESIMSDLSGQKEQSKKVEQAPAEAAADDSDASDGGSADTGDDEAAMEKEAALVPKKSDDAENVVDGAMAYIRTRLATEQHKSMRLRQLLSQSVRGNKNMRTRIEDLRKQLATSTALEKHLQATATKKLAEEEAEVAKQKKRGDTATGQLTNATRAAQIGEKAMKFLGMKLKYAKSQVAALLLNLANSSEQNKGLRRHLDATSTKESKEAQLLLDARKTMSAQARELMETKAKLKRLEAVNAADHEGMKKMDRAKDFLEQRQVSATKRDQLLHKENALLKTQLKTEIQREEQLREMWSKESEAFTWQLRAERANASESLSDLEKARAEFRDLRTRVGNLRNRASHGEASRHQAEDAANRAQFALAEAEAENKQLKGSVPWLEAEVDRQRFEVKNITAKAQQAIKERDTVKAILSEAQKNIVQLQGQYADALQALVVAQAGGSDASKPQEAPGSSIQQFAGLDTNLLGAAPPVTAPIGYPEITPAASLLEMGRDSQALSGMVNSPASEPHGRVDLSKDSGGLNALLLGMSGAH